jgi:hypothetical protein
MMASEESRMSVSQFPITQHQLKAAYEASEEIACFSKILKENAMISRSSISEITQDILLPSHILLDFRREHDAKLHDIAQGIRAGVRIQPGLFSAEFRTGRLIVLRKGTPAPGLDNDWVIAEKDWEQLTLLWVDENYPHHFGLGRSQLLGNRVDGVFGKVYGPDLLHHEQHVQTTRLPTVFDEIVSVRGVAKHRHAVRFPIYSDDNLRQIITEKKKDVSRSVLSRKPLAMGCICWDAA